MKKLFLRNRTVYEAENGELKELGTVEVLESIMGDVFKGYQETFVIKGNKISTLSKNAYPMRINHELDTDIPHEIRDFKNNYQTVINPFNRANDGGLLYEKYFQMLAEFSLKDFENLSQNAVVCHNGKSLQLFIRNESGNFVEQKNIINLGFELLPAFIYRGGIYAQSNRCLRFVRIDFKPLVVNPNYMIFWGGNKNLFSLQLGEKNIYFQALGKFADFIKTDVNQLIKTGDEVDGYTIYQLGKKLEKVVFFESYENCTVNQTTGDITHDYDFTMDGVDYPQTKTYKLVKGLYKAKD